MFMHGTAYYRHAYHPREKYWESDFKSIKQHGLEYIRIWVPWNDIEREEKVYDTARYERMLSLAEKSDLKVMLNFFLETAPYWAYEKFEDAQYRDRHNHTIGPGQFTCYPGGGWPGLCLHHPGVRSAVRDFMITVVERVKDYPSLALWDIWNEPIMEPVRCGGGTWRENIITDPPKYCYCKHTQNAFREWVEKKYSEIDDLNDAWGTTYADFRLIKPPSFPRVATSWTDWKLFLLESLAEQAGWKTEVIKQKDSEHTVVLHAPSFSGGPTNPELYDVDDWLLQSQVDGYGVSFYPTIWFNPLHPDPAGWMYIFDGTRSACKKDREGQYHLGEMQCTQTAGSFLARETPEWQIWLSHIATLACANTGIIYWQWRPEELGSEASFYGLVGTDGSPKLGAKIAHRFSKLIGKISPYWDTPQVKSKVAILFDPKSFFHCFSDGHGKEGWVKESIEGYYKLCWDLDVPADIVHESFLSIDELMNYSTLIMPFPLQIQKKTAEILKEYVKKGGKLIAEAYLGRFQDFGWAAEVVPCYGLDELFGCQTVDVYSDKEGIIQLENTSVALGVLAETYKPIGNGKILATHTDGRPAVVETSSGKGLAMVIGTLLGKEYNSRRDENTRLFLQHYLESEIATINVASPSSLCCRLVHCKKAKFLFVLNFSSKEENPTIGFDYDFSSAMDNESEEELKISHKKLNLKVPSKGARILLMRE